MFSNTFKIPAYIIWVQENVDFYLFNDSNYNL